MTIQDVINVEKKLLTIQDEYRFKLDMGELIQLNQYVKQIGEITSYYFNTLYEFSKTIKSIDELKEYKEKLDHDYVNDEIDLYAIKHFANKITQKCSKVNG